MTANPKVPGCVVAEIQRLFDAGFGLLPIKEDKRPAVNFQKVPRFSKEIVLQKLDEHQSACFGIRLRGLVVLDVDRDDPDLVKYLQKRFGRSRVMTKTHGGFHLYYILPTGKLPYLKDEELPVDVKYGPNMYVIGAGSVRRDGSEYLQWLEPLSCKALSPLRIEASSASTARRSTRKPKAPESALSRTRDGKVPKGQRQTYLLGEARLLAHDVDTADELYDKLLQLREEQCENPKTKTDRQVRGIADQVMKYKHEGRLCTGGVSLVQVRRDHLDLLEGDPFAIALYAVLRSKHGHVPGKVFELDQQAMKRDGVLNVGRDVLRRTIEKLVSFGLLVQDCDYSTGHHRRRYRLG